MGEAMETACYRITEDAHLAATSAEAFLEPWKHHGDQGVWFAREEDGGWVSDTTVKSAALQSVERYGPLGTLF